MQNSLSPEYKGKERSHLQLGGVRDFAIFLLDRAGYVVSWNQGAENIHGHRGEEILGEHFSNFSTHDDILAGRPARLLEIAAKKDIAQEECWRVRKNGARIWASVVISALRDGQGRIHGFSVMTQDLTERRRADVGWMQHSDGLLKLQEEEQRRIARELHDGIAQGLAALSVNLDMLRECNKVARDPEISRALSTCQDLADQAFREIRTISYLMYPAVLDGLGLPEALRWYVEGFTRHTKIKTGLDIPSKLPRLPRPLATGIFRIVQDCLATIQRNSGSRTAEIRLGHNSDTLALLVRDYGNWQASKPSDQTSKAPADPRAGFQAMCERVRLLGGQFEIEPANPGTQVRVILPLPPDAAVSALPD